MVRIPDMGPDSMVGRGIAERTGNKSGALDKRIQPNAPEEPYDPRASANTLAARQGELAALQGTEEENFLGKMTSPMNLIKLGAAAVAAMSGAPGLAAGMGLGTLSRADDDVNKANQQRQQSIDKLTKMVDDQQARLANMLVAQPEAFVNPETGENIVPSDTIQDLLALNVQYNPAAILANAKEGKHDMAKYDVAGQMIQMGIQTKNPADVQLGLSIINETGGMGWSPDYIKSLAYAEVSQIMRMLNEENEPASVLAAAKWAAENGTSMLSPGALRLLTAKSKVEGWNIDSIDDQIKADAYQAMQWFNNVWMNEDVDGIRNRDRYKANPDEALKMAFEENPDAMIKIKKVFPATEHGDEIAKIRTQALMTAASMMPEMQMYMSGALTGTDAEKFEALLGMAQSVTNTANAANNVITLDQRANMAYTAGERAAARFGYENANQAVKNQLGADILSIAHRLALNDGVQNYWTSDTGVRMKYQKLAEDVFMSWQAGDDVIVPAGPAKPAPPPTTAEQVLDTEPEPEVVVEPKVATATQVQALAKDEDMLESLFEKASNPHANVTLPEGYQQAMDDFEVFKGLPEEQRAVMYDDPAFQSSIGIVEAVAAQGTSVGGAVELIDKEAEMQARLRELNKEKDVDRRAKLTRIKKYAEALEWERQMKLLPPETIKAARERSARVKKQATSARNRRM